MVVGQTRKTKDLLDQIETVLHRRFDADTADLVETVRDRWLKLRAEKDYWKRRCLRYERACDRAFERLFAKESAPSKDGAGDSVNPG